MTTEAGQGTHVPELTEENAQDLVRVENFLRAMRVESRWHENIVPLPPGEITPYLQMVMVAAMGTLAAKLPEGTLEIIIPVKLLGSKLLPAKWWTFRYLGRQFDIYGSTDTNRIGGIITEQLHCNACPRDTPYILGVAARPDIDDIFAKAQGPGLEACRVAQKLWADEFEASRLQAATRPCNPQPRSKRL